MEECKEALLPYPGARNQIIIIRSQEKTKSTQQLRVEEVSLIGYAHLLYTMKALFSICLQLALDWLTLLEVSMHGGLCHFIVA